jgi:hypothetical protein
MLAVRTAKEHLDARLPLHAVVLSKFVLSEVMRMHDARKFILNHEIEGIAHKDESKQYNMLQSLLFC